MSYKRIIPYRTYILKHILEECNASVPRWGDTSRHPLAANHNGQHMNAPRVIGALLGIAWILIDAAWIKRQMARPASWPDPLSACALGTMLGQVALLGAWMVWSKQRRFVRLAAMVSGLCLASVASAMATDGWDHTHKWLTLFAVYALLIGIPLVAVKLSAIPCEEELNSSPLATVARNKSRQFSLAGLFSATTCIALLLGVSRWLELPAKHPASLLSFCLAVALLSLILLAISQCRPPGVVGAVALVLLCPLVGWLLPLTGLPPGNDIALILMVSAQGAVIVASVAMTRIAAGNRADHLQTRHS
ncbi:MAG: hypothetical protein ACC628_14380 [Pirellulaceae bacterium]